MKRFLALWLCIALLLPCLTVSGSADADTGMKKETVMIYLCGSTLESGGGAASRDIYEMTRAGFDTEKVNVLVMAGGSTVWLTRFPASKTTIYEIHSSGPKMVWQQDAMNMGDPDTLSTLLQFGYENYPAEKYSLILWDHGGGPVYGFCNDTLSRDSMSMDEFQAALANSPAAEKKLEWIGFDACLMASLEIANACAPYANYLIASEEVEPGTGWDYSFLKELADDSTGADTGKRIVAAYAASLANDSSAYTLSCIDLSKLSALNSAVDELYRNLASDLSADTFSDFSTYRSATLGFGRSVDPKSDYDLVDLLNLSERYSTLEKVGVRQLKRALKKAVVYSQSNLEGASGLSIYHPYYNPSAYDTREEWLFETGCEPFGYQEYLYSFCRQLTGTDNFTDWTSVTTGSGVSTYSNSQWFSVRLNQEQLTSLLSVKFLVLGKLSGDEDAWCQVYSSSGLSASASGLITSRYYGQALYVVDDETGEVRAGPLTGFRTMDNDCVVINAIPADETTYYSSTPLELQYTVNDDGTLELAAVSTYDEALGQYTPRAGSDLQSWTTLIFPNQTYTPATTDDGQYLGFSSWQPSETVKDGWSVINYGWHLEYRIVPISDMKLYGAFQITDIQQNSVLTELIPVSSGVIS